MSQYYNPIRTRNLYDKNSKTLFRLSRSKIDLFLECPRCFYLDRKLGVARPPGFPFSLNSAVDKLLKKEFDIKLISYKGSTDWVEGVIFKAIECLRSKKLPKSGDDCDFCKYRDAVKKVEI